jgi:alkanesulfonate monooxygenase SsuD/methylene tetrahydromethanopterin reductase-like flavin-dependent oxidoreductase (luciferase family)
VRVGYLIDTQVSPLGDPRAAMEAMVEEGMLAERAGFHSVQVPDRHQAGACAFPGPEQLLTLLAYETSRVQLGSFTFVATLTHPMKAAEQFAVIDRLSGGRLATTVSRGFLGSFWGQFGMPEERLLGRFQETLRIWRLACGGARFDFDGEHWQVRGGRLAPAPERPWPLWGGGNAAPAAIRRSAEYADAWSGDPMPIGRSAWDANVALYRERAAELGKRPFVVRMQDGWVADTHEEALRIIGPHYARMVDFYERSDMGRDFGDDGLGEHMLAGTAAECVERLERLHEDSGVDYVVFCCRLSTGPSLKAAREQILRFGEEVVAPIHAKYPAPDHPAIPPACQF